MPTLSNVFIEKLECPITIKKVNKAIENMPMGKSPGPDGPTNAYYKKFNTILVSPLCSHFNKIMALNPLSTEALLAYVTVLPKPGKDPNYCVNYRPISLLNSDIKILAKILALRLQDHIVQLVHYDQTGFMRGRETRENTIRALQILHWMENGPDKIPRIALSMDAEKAFDRVKWGFMMEALKGVSLRRG